MDDTQGWLQRGVGLIQSGVAPDLAVGVATALHRVNGIALVLTHFQSHGAVPGYGQVRALASI